MPENGDTYGMLTVRALDRQTRRYADTPIRPLMISTLGITHPIIQAPMAGANATPPALVAAVGNAGGLGFSGAAYMPPKQIARGSAGFRPPTASPFGINLFAPVESPPPPTAGAIQSATAALARYHD